MSKHEGKKIAIKFTENIVGDVEGNATAFTVTGQELLHIGGELVDGDYQIDTVERYPIPRAWELGETLELDDPGELSITDTECYEVTSGTTLIGTVSANTGDIVLATISHRSVFTMPDGWTKLYESELISGDTYKQKMVFAIKTIDIAGQVSFTAKQSSAGRIYLNLISVGGASRIEHDLRFDVNNPESGIKPVPVPDKALGEKLIWGMTAPLWASSNYQLWATSPNDLQNVSLSTNTQPRQANFIDYGEGQASNRTFTPNPNNTNPGCAISAVTLIQEYDTEKIYETNRIILDEDLRIKWNAEIPTSTDITIEISSDKQNWQEVENGDVISADGIWIKATLTTDDETVTPILKGLWLEEPEQRQNTILLTMKPLKRFNNVEGKLTVSYDALIGNLTGGGGAVESFEKEFTPTDLVATPNPRVTEFVSVAPVAVTADLISIEHLDAFAEETITVAPVSVTATLIPIDETNP